MHTDMKRFALLEAALFTTDEPLSMQAIAKMLKTDEENAMELLEEIKKKYAGEEHGIVLSETGGYRLTVKPSLVEKVSHLTPHADMSRGLLRVLSIITYHEPVKQSDIVRIVGNRTYEYVKELEKRGFVKSEKKSRTRVLGITPTFEEYFGVKKQQLKENVKEMKENHEADNERNDSAGDKQDSQ